MIRNNIGILIIIAILAISCKKDILQDANQAEFYECEYTIDWNDPLKSNKWIDDEQEAIYAKLNFENPKLNNRNTDSLYNKTVQYIFALGGGRIFVTAEKCIAHIQNDSIIICYDPIIYNAEVGEAATSRICMEIDKLKYPNYKSMKIKYVRSSCNGQRGNKSIHN